jgi:hypothetical protein
MHAEATVLWVMAGLATAVGALAFFADRAVGGFAIWLFGERMASATGYERDARGRFPVVRMTGAFMLVIATIAAVAAITR